ncbi:MAG: hypothetical protein EZS28_044102 [Streblomastix strix]|uniref:Uncharacterized protein n=1 Tax=Streblomastix strix TaxID=222440 RepID=A0A5J4TSC6_9EUKA|nr:MAG: hypothetical protein EZS28_044102 [Streblomastix strix]
MYKCFDMDRLHFIEGDTDSAYWAVSGKSFSEKSASISTESINGLDQCESDDSIPVYKQQFKHVIKDQQFYNENVKYFFSSIEGDLKRRYQGQQLKEKEQR